MGLFSIFQRRRFTAPAFSRESERVCVLNSSTLGQPRPSCLLPTVGYPTPSCRTARTSNYYRGPTLLARRDRRPTAVSRSHRLSSRIKRVPVTSTGHRLAVGRPRNGRCRSRLLVGASLPCRWRFANSVTKRATRPVPHCCLQPAPRARPHDGGLSRRAAPTASSSSTRQCPIKLVRCGLSKPHQRAHAAPLNRYPSPLARTPCLRTPAMIASASRCQRQTARA